MKRLTALLLCVIITFSCAACAKDNKNQKKEAEAVKSTEKIISIKEEDILGQWKVTLSLENALSVLGYTLTDLVGDLTAEDIGCNATIDLVFVFEEEGKGALVLTGQQIDSFFLNVYTSFYTYLSDYDVATEMYEKTKTELDEKALDDFGVSGWPAAMEKEIENINTQAKEAPAEDSLSAITYKIDQDRLIVTYEADSTVEIYKMQDSQLVCIKSDNTEGDPSVYTYSKVK
ncbi:MAG: hypothetical protein IKU52_03125 [Clostridia bacterium]|nr:hypothetical protein [Clostridia bacterium]